MTPALLYVNLSFCCGLSLLLLWAYIIHKQTRSYTVLLKSVVIFVLPGALIVSAPFNLSNVAFGGLISVLIEEILKLIGALAEKGLRNRFFIVVLFGIWELMLVKPLWGLAYASTLAGWTSLQVVGLMAASLVTVLMHSVTAEVYARQLTKSTNLLTRLSSALGLGWIIHATFNVSVDAFGVSLSVTLLQLIILSGLFLWLFPRELAENQC